MGVELFQTNVEFDAVASKLSIGLDDSTGDSRLIFAMTATTGGAPVVRELAVSLSDADGLTAASFSYDGLDRTYTLTVDLSDTVDGKKFGERIDLNGVAGASFNANASLSSLKVVLRPRPPGGDWTSDHPSFALMACWEIDGRATQSWEDPDRPVEVNVEAAIEVCVGLSVVVPNDLDLGLPNFQVRLDLPSIGLATKWVPLSWFEWPDLMPLKMEGLLAWFSGLLDFDWAQLPDIPLPRLPQWDVDLPLSIDLPLGVGVVSTHLHLRKASGQGLVVDASAEGFYLTWQGRRSPRRVDRWSCAMWKPPGSTRSRCVSSKPSIRKQTRFRPGSPTAFRCHSTCSGSRLNAGIFVWDSSSAMSMAANGEPVSRLFLRSVG